MATSTAQAIATVPVWDYLMAPGDPTNTTPKGLPGKKVKVTLSYAQGQSASPVTLLGTDPVPATTDPNGFWQVNLVPNNKISPSGTIYTVEIEGYRSYVIQVTDVNAPAIGWQSSAIATLPPIGGGAPGYTLPGGTTVLGAFTVQGLLDQQGLSQFDLRSTFAQGPLIDITHPNYGAKGDCRWIADAAITTGTPNLTSATAAFTAADVGKRVVISGAGAGVSLQAAISAYVSPTAVTLSVNANNTVAGKNASIGTDNAIPIQKAINYQQLNGGRIKVPLDSYGGKYLVDNAGQTAGLIPAPGSFAGGFTDATRDLVIEGDGMYDSFIVAGNNFLFQGLIGYLAAQKCARVVCSDLTLDGNWTGAAGGADDQVSGGALLAMPWPFTPATGGVYNGIYHDFERVRLYRPSGYGAQPTQAIRFTNCLFDTMGERGGAGTHFDNLGSSQGAAILHNCTWINSDGNYVDFVDSVGGAGHMLRLEMLGCESFNHQGGGIYALGLGSIIMGNRLRNNTPGSGIYYDGGTAVSMRAKNIAAFNVTDNLSTGFNVIGAANLYGDISFGNMDGGLPNGVLGLWTGALLAPFAMQSIPYAAAITPDISKGQVIQVGTLTGAMTVNAPTNVFGPGQLIVFQFTEDATGGRVVSWNAFYGAAPRPVPTANSVSYVAFITDAVGNLHCITPFPVDFSGTAWAGDTPFLGGISLKNGAGSPFSFVPPFYAGDGTSLIMQAANASIYFRPTDGTNKNALIGGVLGAGTWITADASAAVRNQLDDGAGNIQVKFHLYPGAEAGGNQVLGGFLHSTGVPSNANGNNKDWCISDNGHLYFRTGGVWVDMTAAVTAQATPGNPAGTASTVGVMMGLAGTITPVRTGNILVIISGDIFNNTINDGGTVQIRTGTGTAPINGAALTGTAQGGKPATTAAVGSEKSPFSVQAVVTGLTLGTSVWLDLAVAAVTGGTATVENISISSVEV